MTSTLLFSVRYCLLVGIWGNRWANVVGVDKGVRMQFYAIEIARYVLNSTVAQGAQLYSDLIFLETGLV